MNKTKPLSFELDDLTMRIDKSKNLKIACFSIPNFGHMFPMSHVAIALKARGHDVHVITNGNEVGREKVPQILAHTDIPIIFADGPEQSVMWEKPKGMKVSNEVYFDAWEKSAIKAVKDFKPDIVVCDFYSRFGAIAADEMGIPSLIVVA